METIAIIIAALFGICFGWCLRSAMFAADQDGMNPNHEDKHHDQ